MVLTRPGSGWEAPSPPGGFLPWEWHLLVPPPQCPWLMYGWKVLCLLSCLNFPCDGRVTNSLVPGHPYPLVSPHEHERAQAAAFNSNLSPMELSRRWISGVSWRQKCHLPCGLDLKGNFHEIRPRYLMSPGQNNETLHTGNLGVWKMGSWLSKADAKVSAGFP